MDKTNMDTRKSIGDALPPQKTSGQDPVAGDCSKKPRGNVQTRTASIDPVVHDIKVFSVIRAGDIAQLRPYLDKGGKIGDLMVATAAAAGFLDIVKMLLEKGLPKDMTTASVHHALKNGHDATAAYLLERGAPVDVDPMLSLVDKPNAVRFLLQKKFLPKPGALAKAICEKQYEVMLMLLEAGVSTCERSVQNAIRRGIFDGDSRMLEIVLKHEVTLDSACLTSLRRHQSPALRLLWESLPPSGQRSAEPSNQIEKAAHRSESVTEAASPVSTASQPALQLKARNARGALPFVLKRSHSETA